MIAASVAALAVVVYVGGATLWEVAPGTPLSIGFGVAAAILLLGAALYGARRRLVRLASRRSLGTASSWLAFHLYGSLLFLLLVHLHSGFAVPSEGVTWWLWALSWWTVVTGVAGRLLQLWIPRALGSGLSVEVLYERIPELIEELRERSETLAATCDESVQNLYSNQVAKQLTGPRRRWIYFVDPAGGARSQLREFDYLRTMLPPEEQDKLDRLAGYLRTKLEFDAHYTLQGVLRSWLWIHVPPSLAVLALVIVHVFAVTYY